MPNDVGYLEVESHVVNNMYIPSCNVTESQE